MNVGQLLAKFKDAKADEDLEVAIKIGDATYSVESAEVVPMDDEPFLFVIRGCEEDDGADEEVEDEDDEDEGDDEEEGDQVSGTD